MNTARRIFLVLFTLSTLSVLMLVVFSTRLMTVPVPVTQEPGVEPTTSNPSAADPSAQNSSSTNYTALIGSVIASATSLIGFATTTVITWRKEKREASLVDMERKRMEIELEKSKFELERLKKRMAKKSKK